MATALLSPPPSSSHRLRTPADSRDIVNMETLIWPPPQDTPKFPSSSQFPTVTSPSAASSYQPFNATFPRRRSQRTFRLDENGPSDATIAQRRSRPVNPYTQQPAAGSSRIGLHPTPLSPSSLQANAKTPYVQTPPPGIKDYPAGYSPTPIPSPKDLPDHVPAPAFPSSRTDTSDASIPFFEPLVVDRVLSRTPSWFPGRDFLSPVLENGRPVNLCRVPSQLGPGGVVEPGWPAEFARSHSYSQTAQSRSQSRSRGRTGTHHPQSSVPQSPLRYQLSSPSPSSTSPPVTPPPASHSTTTTTTPQQRSQSQQPSRPTRYGYWNRRGDTIGPSGHVRPAPSTQLFPPDLAGYPKYALMNELGQLTLPATGQERIACWRNYQE